jgi:hypothetical protein
MYNYHTIINYLFFLVLSLLILTISASHTLLILSVLLTSLLLFLLLSLLLA